MKIIGTALTLSILALLAVWYFPTMYWGYQVSKNVAHVQAGDTEKFEELAELFDGPPLIAWLRRNKRMNATFNPSELTKGRYVLYKIEKPFEVLLQSGETAPDPAFNEHYAEARAPQTLVSPCPEVLQKLATKCDVAETSATISRDGMVRLSGQLQYVPSYDMGDPSAVRNGKLISANARLVEQHDLRNTPENRALMFERALHICAEVRTLLGNCVISAVRFDTSLRGEVETLNARASFDVYADSTQYRRDSLQAEVDGIAYNLLN